MTNDLLLAILAMDANNRSGPQGTSVGLVVPGTAVGDATVLTGPAGQLEDPTISFFAQAYSVDGETVISFLGTDDLLVDPITGWPAGAGAYTDLQALAALQFYQQVVGANPSLDQLYAANVVLTGHSLGGGLAGLIAAVYGKQADVFAQCF